MEFLNHSLEKGLDSFCIDLFTLNSLLLILEIRKLSFYLEHHSTSGLVVE
jgi:hypothetical protein